MKERLSRRFTEKYGSFITRVFRCRCVNNSMIQLHSFWFAKSRRPLRFTLYSTLYSRNYFNASDIHDDYTIVNRPIIVRTGSCDSYYIVNVPRWNNIPVKKLPNPILTNPRGLHCFVNAYFDIPSILSYNYTDVLTPWHASIAHFRIKLDISDCHGSFVYVHYRRL